MTQIFLNYRRDNSKIPAKITYDELEKRFGAGSVFKDLARLNAGEDFEAAINRSLNAAKVILVLMGPTWLDGDGSIRRIEDPNDFVRAEIRGALTRGMTVVPVLIDDTVMPSEQELPEDIRPLAKVHAARLRFDDGDYEADLAKLMDTVKDAIAPDVSPPTPVDQLPPPPPMKAVQANSLYLDAKNGNTAAMLPLGEAYARGSLLVKQDWRRALDWFELARRMGHAPAIRKCADVYLSPTVPKTIRNLETGVQLLTTAAAQDAQAHALLGKIYLEGRKLDGRTVPADPHKAKYHFEHADAADIVSATMALARIHEEGIVPPVNKARALEYIQKADRLGDPTAMMRVALMHYQANGAPRDYALAKVRFERAAEKGQFQAHQYLGEIHENGLGCEVDYGNARHHYEAATKHRVPLAVYKLARLQDQGRGGPRNLASAGDLLLNWLKIISPDECRSVLDRGLRDWSQDLREELQKNLAKRSLYFGPITGVLDEATLAGLGKFIGLKPNPATSA